MRKTILKQALIVLIGILFCFSAVLYLFNITIVKQSTEKDVINQIESRQQLEARMHQNLFLRIQSNVEPLLYSPDIFSFAEEPVSGTLSPKQIRTVYDLRQEMHGILLLNDSIQSIYIHFPESNYIISTEHFQSDPALFYDQDWVQSVEQMQKTRTIPTFLAGTVQYETGYQTRDYDCIRYIFPYTSHFTTQPVYIAVNCNVSTYDQLFHADSDQDLLVINSSRQLVYHSVEDQALFALLEQNFDEICQQSEDGAPMMLADEYLLTFTKDLYQNVFINVAEYNRLFSSYDGLLLRIYLIVAVLLLAAGFAWYFATLKLYSPVSRAIQNIRRLSEGFTDDTMIDKAVENLVAQVKNNEMMREEQLFFDRVLEHPDTIGENPYLTQSHFCAVCLLMDDAAALQWEGKTKELVLNVICEIFKEHHMEGIGKIMGQNGFAFLISFTPKPQTSDCTLEFPVQILRHIQQKVEQLTGHTSTIGVGDVYRSVRHLSFSMEEARHRAQRRMLLGKNQIISESENANAMYLPTEESRQLIRAIENRNAGELNRIMDTLLDGIAAGGIPLSLQGATVLTGYLYFELCSYDMQHGQQQIEVGELYQKTAHLETLAEILNDFRGYLCSYLEKSISIQSEEFSILQKASQFIRSNYQKDIDVNTVAQNVGVSYNRLRRMILDEFGINIVDYINTMRITEAKTLLCATTHTLAEIAEAVGYNNEQSLTRYFKKFEGCSPGEYRRKAHQQTEGTPHTETD